jgi:hypothetical protein
MAGDQHRFTPSLTRGWGQIDRDIACGKGAPDIPQLIPACHRWVDKQGVGTHDKGRPHRSVGPTQAHSWALSIRASGVVVMTEQVEAK